MAELRTNTNIGSVVEVRLYYYVENVEKDGWLRFLYEYKGKKYSIFLPQYTKLQILKIQNQYTLFKVISGNSQAKIEENGKEIHITLKDKIVWLSTINVSTRLSTNKPNIGSGAKLILKYKDNYHSKAKLMFENNSIEVIFDNPIQKEYASYKIFAPDYPHKTSDRYADITKYHRVWFAIEYGDNSRYIHTGTISAGCVTTPLKYWERLYKYLISNQSEKDGQYVGILQITKES